MSTSLGTPLRLVVDNTPDTPDPAAPVLLQRIAAVRGTLLGARDELSAILDELYQSTSLNGQLSEAWEGLDMAIDYVTPDPGADEYCCPIHALERGFIR